MANAVGTVGERLFARYVADREYHVLGRDVDLGTPKRPDFLIGAAGQEIVVEVKTFDPPSVPHGRRHNGFVRRDLGPIRTRIGNGAKQLRGIDGRPLVVLLTSPMDPFVPLAHTDVIEAMYGDLHVRFEADGPPRAHLGSNAKLRIVEEDGSAHGDHAYLSAVAVLRCAPATERRIAVWMTQNIRAYRSDLAAFSDALYYAEQHSDRDDVVYLEVFETVSLEAVPLSRAVFDGPLDSRWGEVRPGSYGPLK